MSVISLKTSAEPKPVEEGYSYDEILANAPLDPLIDWTNFDYPGITLFNFAASDAPVRILMGPFGGAKTSVAFFEHVSRARRMPFMREKDGNGCPWRHYKGLIVRDTFRNLYKTTIPSWWEWFPPDPKWGAWTGGQDRPAKHIIVLEDEYGPIKIEIDFAAVGEANLEQFFKGYAVVGVQFEEIDGLPREAVQYALGRAGRFPKKDTLADPNDSFWRGVWGTLNAPDFDHWIYDDFVENADAALDADQQDYLDILREEFGYEGKRLKEFFKQPSGLSPQAENIANLPRGYYQQLSTGDKYWVRKNVHNEFGYSRAGDPVFLEEFDDDTHFSREKLDPTPGLPIDVSFDAGGHPAFLVRQMQPNGQKRVLREIVNAGGGVGPTRFAGQVQDLLERDFPGYRIGEAWGDPSAWFGGDKQGVTSETSDRSFAKTLINITGIPFKPAPSNAIDPRLDAVRNELEGRIDHTVPELLICRSCKTLRRGMNSKYAFAKDEKTGQVKDGKRPQKTPGISDIQDCLQYAALGNQGLANVEARHARREMARIQQRDRLSRRRGTSRPTNAAKGGFSVFT